MNAPHHPPRHDGHIPALDGLRGLAIVLVVLHNTGAAEGATPTLGHRLLTLVHMHGWGGVHLFFVLSGFLITGVLLDENPNEPTSVRFRRFFLRRVLRIFPLYYASLFLAFAVAPLFVPRAVPPTPAAVQVWYWTYLINWVEPYGVVVEYFSHFWSLAVEEQFYLLWPVVVLGVTRTTLLRVCGALTLVALLARLALVAGHWPGLASYQFTVARMDALVLGAAAAVLVRRRDAAARLRRPARLGLGLTFALFVLSLPFTHGFGLGDAGVRVVGHLVFALMATFLVLVVVFGATDGALASRVFCHPALRGLGRYSYGIYVAHLPIVLWLRPRFVDGINSPSFAVAASSLFGYFALVWAATIPTALVSWHVLEKRCIALKEILAPRAPPPASPPATEPAV